MSSSIPLLPKREFMMQLIVRIRTIVAHRLRIYRQSINDIGNLQLGTLCETFCVNTWNRSELKNKTYLIRQLLAAKVRVFLA